MTTNKGYVVAPTGTDPLFVPRVHDNLRTGPARRSDNDAESAREFHKLTRHEDEPVTDCHPVSPQHCHPPSCLGRWAKPRFIACLWLGTNPQLASRNAARTSRLDVCRVTGDCIAGATYRATCYHTAVWQACLAGKTLDCVRETARLYRGLCQGIPDRIRVLAEYPHPFEKGDPSCRSVVQLWLPTAGKRGT